ncbi:MAG: hypothetical protein E7162_07500 [Firmicutes bacterium]|nr:hypothetical protein [Bacillota bacterium]
MLTKRMLKKIFVTSSIMVMILLIYLMPGVIELDNNDIATSVEYVDLTTSTVYLLDNDDLLVEANVSIVDDGNVINKIKSLIKHLSEASSEIIPNGLNFVMPKDIHLLDVSLDEKIVKLNFSKEFNDLSDKRLIRLVEAISFTLIDLDEVDGVSIFIEGKNINTFNDKIPEVVTKDFGINKKYDIEKTDDIVKYVIYYSEKIEDDIYYVPITKYINSSSDKISIIIDDLSSNYIYEPNLISIVSEKLELIDYQISNNEMMLNFNNSIFLNGSEIKEEVVYPVISTVFSNYDVESVILKVNGEEILKKTSKNS